MAGKQFLRKVASRLCKYPAGQKFRWNRSISLCFWDKSVFAFKAEIQDGHQKWRENDFWEKSPVDSADTYGPKILSKSLISLRFQDKCIFAFYAEIQNGRKKWRKNDFWGKLPEDSAVTLWVKNFVEKIILSCSVSGDKLVFAFNTEMQDGCQKWRENDIWEKSPVDSANTLWAKNFAEIALSCSISEINAFLRFQR